MVKELQRYDFTYKCDLSNLEDLCDFLTEWCSKWVFQEEMSEGGYHHYQGRVNLIKAKSESALINTWSKLVPGIHLSITSNATKDFCYVMKADTRIGGPWSNEAPPKRMTPQLQNFMKKEMYKWQKWILKECEVYDERKINVILDEIGNCGKSIMAEYLEYADKAYEIPPFTAMEDIMQCCMGIKAQRCYLIDMPRGMKKEKLASFYAGIEALKNGVMYDKRYAFKKRRIARPNIFIFTNMKPDVKLLTTDRWRIMRISNDKDVYEVDTAA